MKIVTKNNRVVAHGGDYIVMGGTVVDTQSQKVFTDATVVECDSCPADIDTTGYEYHSGRFIPCAPYGLGSGNLAVVCNESCKSIKDSGFSIDTFAGLEVLPYDGTGKTRTLSFQNIEPSIVFFQPTGSSSATIGAGLFSGFAINGSATAIALNKEENPNYQIDMPFEGKTLTLGTVYGAGANFNLSGASYIAVGFGKRVN